MALSRLRRASDSAARVLAPTPRERSAVTPRTLPPLSERPLIAVETTVVPFVDDGPGLPMTTLVEPRGMVKRRVGTSPGRVDQAAPGGLGGPGRTRRLREDRAAPLRHSFLLGDGGEGGWGLTRSPSLLGASGGALG